jgi:hypothetical protein
MRCAEEGAWTMTETVSKTKILLARFVVALMLAFVVLGAVLYGFSAEVFERIWQNMLDRTGGPMTFRFFLQPIMASIAALYMDVIYQLIEFETFHPAEAVIIALLLAFVPYVLLRGPVARIARWWHGGGPARERGEP